MSDPICVLLFDDGIPNIELENRLLSWKYDDDEKTGKLELVYDNRDGVLTDPDKTFRYQIETGVLVSFRHGYTDDLSHFKEFFIVKTEGWKILTIEALEAIHIFTTKPITRSWLATKLSKVVGDIADRQGLGYETEERTDADGIPLLYDYLQANIEDLAFLYILGREIGYDVWIEDEVLYFLPKMYWQAPYMSFVYEGIGEGSTRCETGNVLDFDPKINIMNRKGKFSGGGIDLEKKSHFMVTESGQTKRASYIGKKFIDFDKMMHDYGTMSEARLVRVPMRNKKEAQDILAGKWIREMEDQVTADLTIHGEPHLKARRVIEVLNVGIYSGKYYVKSVEHDSEGGYVSVAKLSRNAAFDKGAKYSKENILTLVNKERLSMPQYRKEARNKPVKKIIARRFK